MSNNKLGGVAGMMIMKLALGAAPWQVHCLLFLSTAAFLTLLIRAWTRPTGEDARAKKTPRTLYLLRLGACFCVFIAAVGMYFFCSGRNWSDDYTIVRKKYGEYIVAVRPGEEMTAPYSKALYDQAQSGDQLHHGFFFITLTRNGKQLALQVPKETQFQIAWIILTSFTLLAFLPDKKIERKKALLVVIGLLEAAMLGLFVSALFAPL